MRRGFSVFLMRKNWLTILLVIFVLLIVILADSGNLPRPIKNLYKFPYGDKVGHFLLMGFLSFSLNWTVLASRANLGLVRVIWTVSLSLAFLVTLEELSQQFFPKRTFSLLDLAFSYAGIVVFGWLAALVTRKERSGK